MIHKMYHAQPIAPILRTTWCIEMLTIYVCICKFCWNWPTHQRRKRDFPIRTYWLKYHWVALKRSFQHNFQQKQWLPFSIVLKVAPIVTKPHECMEMLRPDKSSTQKTYFSGNAPIVIYIAKQLIFTSKMPSINRTVINAPTPALAANGVRSVNTDVAAIPMPNT